MTLPSDSTYRTSCKLIQQLYKTVDEWKEEGRPAEGAFQWDTLADQPVESIVDHSSLIWSETLVYRRKLGGRHRRYRWAHEEAPVALVSLSNTGTLYIAFRGTNISAEWDVNLRVHKVDFRPNGIDFGKTRYGFTDCFEEMQEALFDAFIEVLDRNQSLPGKDIVITGHSLGGAYATLAFAAMATSSTYQNLAIPLSGLVFGCPRVGSESFAQKFQSLDLPFYRVENTEDPVPKAPFEEMGYAHVCDRLSFSEDTGGLASNHSMQTYLDEAAVALA